MALIKNLKWRMRRVRAGVDTFGEFVMWYFGLTLTKAFNIRTHFYSKSRVKRLKPEFWHGEDRTYHVKDARFPELDEGTEATFLLNVCEDTFYSYLHFDDKYDEATVDYCDTILPEGLYGLVNDKVNVTVRPGDIVIDAGAWIGDFAAYASVKGAGKVYAFEPTDKTFAYLQETAGLNGNIIPVKMGLSDENTSAEFFVNSSGSAGNTLNPDSVDKKIFSQFFSPSSTVETVRLDDFVRENNIPRVDFIKSDIEGFERRMLEGAQETLRKFAPKLAICTYHLPDDPQVLAALIKKANPKYNIVQKRKKLYASVPE